MEEVKTLVKVFSDERKAAQVEPNKGTQCRESSPPNGLEET